MNLKVAVPKTLRWRCLNPHHAEIRETSNPCSLPICCVPTSDWVCSTIMVTIEEYACRRKKADD